ncbi:MAG TPA: substrate-binding domain-containing protein, partial [Leptolyngbyaceae cyanobacterium M65_K2018_010]|nr:substrate-binding domain-containing protein [Leptolyngbyaceae cyanobacterium M65_K2018_010]
MAQTPTTFPVPETVPTGTTLSIQSSPNLGIATQALKQGFESAYDGTTVEVEVTSSDDALRALLADQIDLAAIGRPLTAAEAKEELVTVPLERAKIAIIIGPENPFIGNLTFDQFARMFRGEITDWSEVGGPPGPIRFVDRPENSDVRRSLSQYEVFRNAPFQTGATADPVAEDDTATVIAALGRDGISYAIAPQVLGQSGVKIVPMHQTLPDDPRYPYSQPRFFVFKGSPSPAVAAFLGYATSAQGVAALATDQPVEVPAIAATPATPAPTPTAAPPPAEPVAPTAAEGRGGLGWWWLFPLAGLAGLVWA